MKCQKCECDCKACLWIGGGWSCIGHFVHEDNFIERREDALERWYRDRQIPQEHGKKEDEEKHNV